MSEERRSRTAEGVAAPDFRAAATHRTGPKCTHCSIWTCPASISFLNLIAGSSNPLIDLLLLHHRPALLLFAQVLVDVTPGYGTGQSPESGGIEGVVPRKHDSPWT